LGFSPKVGAEAPTHLYQLHTSLLFSGANYLLDQGAHFLGCQDHNLRL
jgi:hypothetical protein